MARSEWDRNGARRRACSAIILATDERGNRPACALCGQPDADTVDHVLPKAKYPDLVWELGNMQPAHRDCNASKGVGTAAVQLGSLSRGW